MSLLLLQIFPKLLKLLKINLALRNFLLAKGEVSVQVSFCKWKWSQKGYFKHGWKKVNLSGDIPAWKLKGCVDSYISIPTKVVNNLLERGQFQNQLKLAEVTPVFTEEVELNKENYCSVNVVSQPSKTFERIVFNQINLFFLSFRSKFSPLLTGFRKNHSTQNALLNVI